MSPRTPGNYPSRKFLTESELMHDLRHGPKLEWFEPWATRVINMTKKTVIQGQYGYVHVYHMGGAFRVDSASWPDEDGLRWGLNELWHSHDGHRFEDSHRYPLCTECISVVYFTADEPPRLRGEVEPDGVGEEEVPWSTVTRPIGDSTAGDEVDS